jgi:hypothetical protein
MKEKEQSSSLLLSKQFNVPSFARICKKKRLYFTTKYFIVAGKQENKCKTKDQGGIWNE